MKPELLSLTQRRWVPRSVVSDNHRRLARDMGMGDSFAGLLASRGLESVDAVTSFLQPRLHQLADPTRMLGMVEAVDRLVLALRREELIAVFGDYDVDGATASALMARYFRALGVEVRVYIPNRLTEGYGPSASAMRLLAEEGVRLVVTVDCGVTSFEAFRVARECGMEVIVTDHHQPDPEGLPEVLAVVNPNREDETFPHKELAGVGVAFYLVMALNRELRRQGWFHGAGLPEPDLRSLLDLVAIGTVADVAPLVGLNRSLVSAGLRVAGKAINPGLRALLRNAGLLKGEEEGGIRLESGQIGFQVGPRINAGGRMDRGDLGFQLLASEDLELVEDLASSLEQSNRERREMEQKILDEAFRLIDRNRLAEKRLGLVVAGACWHQGVIGIVASRIAEHYHRPTIVISIDEEGVGVGSGRSIASLDLLAAIRACGDRLVTFGGHRAAAGLRIEFRQLEPFAEDFDRAVREQNGQEVFQPTLTVDGSLSVAMANRGLFNNIQQLQPFGTGNPEPVFVLDQLRVVSSQPLKDRHVRCNLVDAAGFRLEAIAFRSLPGPLGEGLLNHQRGVLDVAGNLSLNRYQGTERMQLLIRDARPAP